MLTLLRLKTEYPDMATLGSSFPVPDDGVSMCRLATGRSALYQLTKRLPHPHAHTVLLPCYVAEGVIKPFVAAGFKVLFYPLTPELRPVETAVAALLQQISGRAIFVLIHYFGFSSASPSLLGLLSSLNAFVVNDCAHAPLSRDTNGRSLGELGDVALYSLNKWLPVCDGAILVCRSREFSIALDETMLQPLPDLAINAFKDHLNACRALFEEQDPEKAVAYLNRIGASYETYYAEINDDFDPRRQSDESRHIEAAFSYQDSARLRRVHAERLYREMQSDLIRLVFTSLPTGIVPFCIPARVPAERRDEMLNILMRRGILLSTLADKWDSVPSFDNESFPVERAFLREHVLIPVSEFLTADDMSLMIAELNRLQ